MKGIEIHDSDGRGGLSFDLANILDALGERADLLSWSCANVECLGAMAKRMHELSDQKTTVAGNELLTIASGVHQTIDGDFTGTSADGRTCVVIRAIDSTLFEVFSDEPCLALVADAFLDTRPAAKDAI